MKVWRSALGMEGRYEVSSAGDVRVVGGVVRKPQLMNRGYLTLKISPVRGEKPITRTVHSLVAECFIGPRPVGGQVNHKDGDKLNNRADNLEWVTGAENVKHAINTGLMDPNNPAFAPMRPQGGAGNYNATLSEADALAVIVALKNGEAGTAIARRFGVSNSLVHAIKTGRRWGHLPR